jgi:hypothetical protein
MEDIPMANELVTKNPLSSHFGIPDLALHRDVERLVELGGPRLVTALLVTLGARRMVRTEIDNLVSEYCLLAGPSEGEA